MSLFDTVMRLCREGKRIEISLAAHSMSVGNRVMVRDGIWKGNLGIEKVSAEEALRQIEDAYDLFRRALPSGVGVWWSWFHVEPCSDEEILWRRPRYCMRSPGVYSALSHPEWLPESRVGTLSRQMVLAKREVFRFDNT